MANVIARHDRERINQNIARIRELYEAGKKSLKERPGRATYGDVSVEREAKELGYTPNVYLAARRFADPEVGYTAQEMSEMFVAFKEARSSIGVAQLMLLLGITSKKRRATLQRQAIRGGWTKSRLKLEITGRYGPRRAGGRRRVVPTDATALLTQIESMCDSWGRWYVQLHRVPEQAGEPPVSLLPATLRRHVDNVSRNIAELHAMTEKELSKTTPGRQKRYVASEA